MVFIQEPTYLKNDRPYVINLDEYKSVTSHWISLDVHGNNATYFDSFRV